jgi:hypothetical protein
VKLFPRRQVVLPNPNVGALSSGLRNLVPLSASLSDGQCVDFFLPPI